MGRVRSSLVALMVGCALVGCQSSETEAEHHASLTAGDANWSHPEIGRIPGCTATLIAPRVVITAAHCMQFDTRLARGAYERFFIDVDASRSEAFSVDAFMSFGTKTGEDDIALLHLAKAVPEGVARPASRARGMPARGETVEVWGYGCTERPAASGSGSVVARGESEVKRSISYTFGDGTSYACPGDSGGPRMTRDRAVFALSSAYVPTSSATSDGPDVMADVVRASARLDEAMRAWDAEDAR